MRPLNNGSPVSVSAGEQSDILTLQAHDQWAVLFNESNLACAVVTPLGTRTLPAWTGDLFQIGGNGSQPGLSIRAQAISNQTGMPSSVIIGDIYYDSERPAGVYPIALARQVTVGNSVPVSTSTQQIDGTNSGSATVPQVETGITGVGIGVEQTTSSVVELYPTGPAGTSEVLRLDYRDTGGVLHAALQADSTGIHDLTGQGFQGAISDATNVTPSGHSPAVHAQFGGAAPSHSFLVFDTAGGTAIGMQSFSGVGAGTVSHGLSWTPTFIGVTTTEVNSTETVGVDSIGSSTCQINQGVGGWPWIAFAYAH